MARISLTEYQLWVCVLIASEHNW